MTKAGRVINDWFNANINASPVSRDVDALNHLRGRLGDLEKRLIEADQALGQDSPDPAPAKAGTATQAAAPVTAVQK